MIDDEKYMRMCFALAKQGLGNVSPNPLVGCVVLDKEGDIVSKGYHSKYGENHAERDALMRVKYDDTVGGTLYVNLEPCSHYGKTPPCADLIIERGIARVVIGMRDINPLVDSVSKFKEAGIKVDFVLEEEAKFLNRAFIKNMTQKLPYVVIKTACTMDGKVAVNSGDSKWITSPESRYEVRRMRNEFDCIMTSSNTVIADNPSMKHRFKCVLDKDLKTDKDAQIYQQGKIYIASKENTTIKDGQLDLKSLLSDLYSKGICSIFVECGGTLAGALVRDGLADEVYQFIAPKILNDNSALSCFNGDKIGKISLCRNFEIYKVKQIGPDVLIKYKRKTN